MKKYFFFLFLLSVIILSQSFTSYAVSANTLGKSDDKITIFQNKMTEKEIEEEHKRQIEDELLRMIESSGEIKPFDVPSDYRIEYGTRKSGRVENFAGNQNTGVRFPTGGGFYFSDSGGPSVLLNIGFPEPYSLFSLSVPLGTTSQSGLYVSAPNTTDYFKLSVIKDLSVQPYITYKRSIDPILGVEKWVVFNKSHNYTHVGTQAYAKKVPSP